jgi:hypothetical protein
MRETLLSSSVVADKIICTTNLFALDQSPANVFAFHHNVRTSLALAEANQQGKSDSGGFDTSLWDVGRGDTFRC